MADDDVVNVSRLREQLIALTAGAGRAATRVAMRLAARSVSAGRTLELALPTAIPRGDRDDVRIRMAARHAAMAAMGVHPVDARIEGQTVRLLFPGSMRSPSTSQMVDFQYAFQRQLARDFARLDVTPDRAAAQDMAGRAVAELQHALHEHDAGDVDAAWPAARAGLAIGQAEQATGGRPGPALPSAPVTLDRLVFTIKTEGLDPLGLPQRDVVLREMLARAAGITDPSELKIIAKPLAAEGKHNGEHAVFVMLNPRNSVQRGPAHMDPSRIRELILQNAPQMAGSASTAVGGPVAIKIKAIHVGVRVATAVARAVPAVLQELQQRAQAEISR